ncbi:MAG: hypothetical protein E7231_03230 [Cellulosilyticum sp.]|nr:hypothetical protein [Cellulosilyticum sp.]
MNKEVQALQDLIKDNTDVELVFIKFLLDREIMPEKMDDYARNYAELTEEQKWEFAHFYKKELNKDIFVWVEFLGSLELPLQDLKKSIK